MKTLLKMVKPWLKNILISIGKAEKDKSINFLNAQFMRLNLPISGESLDQLTKIAYESIETIIINKVDQL
jgi:hypothetical protein